MQKQYSKIEKYFAKHKVKSDDRTSPEYFSASIRIAMEEYGLPVSDIIDEFKITPGTLERWLTGDEKSVPKEPARKVILERILGKI